MVQWTKGTSATRFPAGQAPKASSTIDGHHRCPSRFLHGRHWYARNLHPEGAEARAGAEKDGLPVVATEGDVGRVLIAVHDATELLALRIEDIEPACAAAKDIAGRIDLHAVRNARLGSAQVGKNPVHLA